MPLQKIAKTVNLVAILAPMEFHLAALHAIPQTKGLLSETNALATQDTTQTHRAALFVYIAHLQKQTA